MGALGRYLIYPPNQYIYLYSGDGQQRRGTRVTDGPGLQQGKRKPFYSNWPKQAYVSYWSAAGAVWPGRFRATKYQQL